MSNKLRDLNPVNAPERSEPLEPKVAVQTKPNKAPSRMVTTLCLLTLGAALLVVLYSHRMVAGLVDSDAMDFAQLGRNLLAGHGLATHILRPLALTDTTNPLAQPDLTHGPLYPFLLALVFGIAGAKDVVVTGVSALFYVLTVPALYFLGRRLFSPKVGLLASLIFLTNSTILYYASSGTSTTLLLFLATCLFLTLYQAAIQARKSAEDPNAKIKKAPFLLAGLLSGLLYLTEPFLVWMLPVLLVAVAFLPPTRYPARRAAAAGLFALPLALLVLPCMFRFGLLTGNPFFGLRGAELWMDTKTYPGFLAYRLSSSDVVGGIDSLKGIAGKVFLRATNGVTLLQNLPASCVLLFVLPGLFFGFADPALGRLRSLVLGCLVSVFVGTLFLTFNPALLLIAFPGLLVFALHYLMHLSQEARLPRGWAIMASVLFGFALLSPLAASIVATSKPAAVSQIAVAKSLEQKSHPDEVVFSDKPWIVAWYADRPSVWIPARAYQMAAMRKPNAKARWLFLTEDTRREAPEWSMVFDNLMQWNRQFQYARTSGTPLPESLPIARSQAPITEALEGFAPLPPVEKEMPTAVVAAVSAAGAVAQK